MGKLLERLKKLDSQNIDFNGPADEESIVAMEKDDKSVENHFAKKRGYTYLQLAIICQDYEAINDFLLPKGVDVNKPNQPTSEWYGGRQPGSMPLATTLASVGEEFSHKRRIWVNRTTPKIYNLLLDHGAYLSETEKKGFDRAIEAKALIIDFSIGEKNFAKKSHTGDLHKAAMDGDKVLLAELLASSNPIDEPDFFNYTPLHYAVEENHFEVVQLLIDKKANVNALTKASETPLHIAVKNKSPACVEALLNSERVTINAKNADEKTAIDLMCDDMEKNPAKFTEDWKTICELLLKHGALVDAKQTLLIRELSEASKITIDVPLAKAISVELRLQRETKQREAAEQEHRQMTGQLVERVKVNQDQSVNLLQILAAQVRAQEQHIARLMRLVETLELENDEFRREQTELRALIQENHPRLALPAPAQPRRPTPAQSGIARTNLFAATAVTSAEAPLLLQGRAEQQPAQRHGN